ncbi:HRDC domain-containing protein [Paenibacillus ginsengihumi]|uniref:HRDC domain-containing protein n=1 Tax=Paenibacillus ginsengihumi TaxID=431596 RepID=UPI000372D9F7|nr:HRDC domain-containing protein [Paenibacillus ginsengihumi]
MNLMFLNSLEKTTEEGRVRTGQVSIGEHQGQWSVIWSETKEDGRPVQECWFEGIHWDELLAVFRERIAAKQSEGFRPLIEMGAGGIELLDERALHSGMLQYYGEMQADEPLYEELRQWRFKQAARDGKSPFIIASNRMLKMISAYKPHTEEELLQLPGFGKHRAALYAAAITDIVRRYERTTSFPLDWVEPSVDENAFVTWYLEEKRRRRKAEADKRETKRRLLESIGRGDGLEAILNETKLQRRDLVLWVEELDKEGYDMLPFADRMLEEVPAQEREAAREAFAKLGDKYLKPVLLAVFGDKELSAKETERIYEWLRLLRIKYRRDAAASERVEEAS